MRHHAGMSFTTQTMVRWSTKLVMLHRITENHSFGSLDPIPRVRGAHSGVYISTRQLLAPYLEQILEACPSYAVRIGNLLSCHQLLSGFTASRGSRHGLTILSPWGGRWGHIY